LGTADIATVFKVMALDKRLPEECRLEKAGWLAKPRKIWIRGRRVDMATERPTKIQRSDQWDLAKRKSLTNSIKNDFGREEGKTANSCRLRKCR
jgi:hypothetical protein